MLIENNEILKIYKKEKALLEGHFILSSGKRSSVYLQSAIVLSMPVHLKKIASELGKKIKKLVEIDKINLIVSPAMGGIIIGSKIGEVLNKVQNEDLLKFGMIPEFIGRLPVCATLEDLDKKMLVRIMTEPKNAILKQFEVLFKMDNVELEIKNDALIEISKLAVERKTGARGLRSIMENLLVDLMYDAPDQKNLKKIVINKDVVIKKNEPMLMFANKENTKIAVNKS